MKIMKKAILGVVAVLGLCLAFPSAGHADWARHDDRAVVAVPGLTIALGDRDFGDRWGHADYNERARFCHDVRRDCDYGGRYSRACHLKWQYCTPHHQDYGYYFNR